VRAKIFLHVSIVGLGTIAFATRSERTHQTRDGLQFTASWRQQKPPDQPNLLSCIGHMLVLSSHHRFCLVTERLSSCATTTALSSAATSAMYASGVDAILPNVSVQNAWLHAREKVAWVV